MLRARYTATNLERKLINKRAVQSLLGLDPMDVPLLGVVSRLAHQKGIDLILALVDALVSLPAQLAVLGHRRCGNRTGVACRKLSSTRVASPTRHATMNRWHI